MNQKFTPALGYRFLTPIYDLVIGVLTRENNWRGKLIRLVAPKPGERILDVGCGTGSLAIRLSDLETRRHRRALCDCDLHGINFALSSIDKMTGFGRTLPRALHNELAAMRGSSDSRRNLPIRRLGAHSGPSCYPMSG